MDILKNSKYQFILIAIVAGISILLLIIFFVNKIRTILGDDGVNSTPQTEISFSIGDTQKKRPHPDAQNEPKSLAKKVSTYQDAQKEEAAKPNNKNISFSSVFKDSKKKERSREVQSDDLTSALNQEIKETRQGGSVKHKTSSVSKTSTSKPTTERSIIEEQIRSVYSQNPVTSKGSSSTSPPRPKTDEEILAEKKTLMEQGFGNNSEATPASNSNAVSIVSPQEITAFIHGSQTVGRGERVTIRIDNAIEMSDGYVIPRNTLVYGYITMSNNRANISIESIKTQQHFYNIPLAGFSSDGMMGVPISIDQTQKIVSNRTSDAVTQGVSKAARMTPIGAVAGNVLGDLSRESKREKEVTVSFIANHKLFLRQINKN